MATAENASRSKEARVLVRTSDRGDKSPEDVLRSAERWEAFGFRRDLSYSPVQIRPPRAERAEYESKGLVLWVVRGFIDPTRIGELEAKGPGVLKVSRDAAVDPLKVDCGGGSAVGTVIGAAIALGVKRIWKSGYKGQGIIVGVVDGGITAYGRNIKPGEIARINGVVGGWPADWGTTALGWGANNEQHGNMVAFNVLAMAPQARLWDIRIWEDVGGTPATRFAVYVSNALAGYRFSIDNFRNGGVPQILTNSWGLYDRNNGIEYATHPDSDFALIVEEALDAGMFVLFAGGNCGTGCVHGPTSPCGAMDRGPNNSILGPNGHPEVMTVGGATVRGDWYGYTSQGRAVLPPNAAKPDFCSMTRFEGFFPSYGPKPYDGGTSTACATAAGVVALLKGYRPALTQAQVKAALTSTALDIQGAGADMDSGAGIIRAYAAFKVI